MSGNRTEQRPTWRPWRWGLVAFLWVIASSLTSTASLLLANAVAFQDWAHWYGYDFERLHGDSLVPALLQWAFSFFLFLGGSMGISQAIVLSFVSRHSDPLIIGLMWSIVTIIGIFTAALVYAVGGWPLTGLILGAAQWLVLRRLAHLAGWWVVANSVAWLITLLVGVIFYVVLTPPKVGRFVMFYPPDAASYFALFWATGMTLFAMITGTVLVWLLQRPIIRPSNINEDVTPL